MLSDTLQEGLEAYEIGPAIRKLRASKDLGLEQLGKHTGLSAAMLSRIERGLIFPTLPTLLRISMVFGVGLEHFFATPVEKPTLTIVRKGDRLRMPNTTEGKPKFHFESLDFPVADRPIETFLAEFSSPNATEAHAHAGIEIIYVISGALDVTVQGEVHHLREGDSMYFDSAPPHSYANAHTSNTSALVTIKPKTS